MSRFVQFVFVSALMLSAGCGSLSRRNYFRARLTGVALDCASPAVAADFKASYIVAAKSGSQTDFSSRLAVRVNDRIVSKFPVCLEIASQYKDQLWAYQALMGTGFNTSSTSETRILSEVPASVEMAQGWVFWWGYRPHGQAQLVKAWAGATTFVMKREVTGVEYVFLLKESPPGVPPGSVSEVRIACLGTTSIGTVSPDAPYVLRGNDVFLSVKRNAVTGECEFDPPQTDDTLPVLGAVIAGSPQQTFIDQAKLLAGSLGWQ